MAEAWLHGMAGTFFIFFRKSCLEFPATPDDMIYYKRYHELVNQQLLVCNLFYNPANNTVFSIRADSNRVEKRKANENHLNHKFNSSTMQNVFEQPEKLNFFFFSSRK